MIRIRFKGRNAIIMSDRQKVTDCVAHGIKAVEEKLQKEDLRGCMRTQLEEILLKLMEFQEQLNEGKEPWKDLPEIQRANLTRMLGLKGE